MRIGLGPWILLASCVPPEGVGPAEDEPDTVVAGPTDDLPPESDPPDETDTAVAPPGSTLVEGGARPCAARVGARDATPVLRLHGGSAWADQDVDPENNGLFVGGGFGVGDLDGDGRLDLLVTSIDAFPKLWLQGGPADAPTFTLASDRLPEMPERTTGVTLIDVDDDGDLDAHVTALTSSDTLLIQGADGRFTDVAEAWGLQGPEGGRSIGASWTDLDHDGDLDAFVGGYGKLQEEGSLPDGEPSQLWMRQTDTTFVDLVPALTPFEEVRHPLQAAHTFGGAFSDVDDDGWSDLFLVNDFGWRYPTMLLRNAAGVLGWPSPEGVESSAENMGLGVGDIDGDGIPDFLVAAWDITSLFLSKGGPSWFEASASRGIVPDHKRGQRVGWAADLGDVDNDGDLDALVVYGHLPVRSNHVNPDDQPDALYLQGEDGRFTDVAPAWGVDDPGRQRGGLLVDIDQDGWLDIIKTDLRGPVTIDLGVCDGSAWLEVALEQPAPNVHGIGARVRVRSDDRSWFRDLRAGGTGYASSGPAEVHIGLGTVDVVTLEVRWPDGRVDTFPGVPTRQRVRVVRP